MIVAYIIIGFIMGGLSLILALLLGASLWVGFAYYLLVGVGTVFVLAGIRFALRNSEGVNDDEFEQTSASSPVAANGAAPEPSMRILAVDDDPFIRELLPMIAARCGFPQMTCAESGVEALNLLADDPGFDCLLVDINMPEMDGITFCTHVRALERYGAIPIIMLTAMRDLKNMGEAFRAGATDYATKPFDIGELGTRLRLAQDEVTALRRNGPSTGPLGLSDDVDLGGVVNLVERTMLSNYLTGIPRKEIPAIEVFAVKIDQLRSIGNLIPAHEFAVFLADVAKAAGARFAEGHSLMAFVGNGDLLIVTESAQGADVLAMERAIEGAIAHWAPALEAKGLPPATVSIGGPVRPNVERAQRAVTAFGNTIALAESRASGRHTGERLRRISS